MPDKIIRMFEKNTLAVHHPISYNNIVVVVVVVGNFWLQAPQQQVASRRPALMLQARPQQASGARV